MPRMSGGTATASSGGGAAANITQILGLTTAGQQAMASSLPVVIASNQTSFPVTIAAGSAVIGHVIVDSGSVTANAGTNLNTSALALESGGNLATIAGLALAQEATTSGAKGVTAFGAVTTAKPTYVTGKSDALSLDVNGLLRVSLADTPANGNKFLVTADAITFASPQHIIADSGTITTVSNISQIASVTPTFGDVNNATTETGALNVAPVGRYNATQPTLTDTRYNQAQLSVRGELLVSPGVSNFAVQATPVTQVDTFMLGGVNIKEINAVAPLMGNGATGTGSLRVTIASDNTAFAVNSTLSAETTKVIGVTRSADGSGNLLTSNSTTYTAKFGLDGNLLGTLGTAFSTAGKVDVKGADGDVFVRQTTGSNLHTVIDSGTVTNLSQMGGVNISLNAGAVDTGTQRVVQANGTGRTLTSTGGSVSSSGNNTLLSAGTNKLKVFAFSLSTTSTTAVTCIFQSGASGTELWRVTLQAVTGASTGANLAVSPPAWLFATASATLLNLNLSGAQTVHWSASYFDEA